MNGYRTDYKSTRELAFTGHATWVVIRITTSPSGHVYGYIMPKDGNQPFCPSFSKEYSVNPNLDVDDDAIAAARAGLEEEYGRLLEAYGMVETARD